MAKDRNDVIWADHPDIEGGPVQMLRSALPFHAGYVEVDEPVPAPPAKKSGQPTTAAKPADNTKEKQA